MVNEIQSVGEGALQLYSQDTIQSRILTIRGEKPTYHKV